MKRYPGCFTYSGRHVVVAGSVEVIRCPSEKSVLTDSFCGFMVISREFSPLFNSVPGCASARTATSGSSHSVEI